MSNYRLLFAFLSLVIVLPSPLTFADEPDNQYRQRTGVVIQGPWTQKQPVADPTPLSAPKERSLEERENKQLYLSVLNLVKELKEQIAELADEQEPMLKISIKKVLIRVDSDDLQELEILRDFLLDFNHKLSAMTANEMTMDALDLIDGLQIITNFIANERYYIYRNRLSENKVSERPLEYRIEAAHNLLVEIFRPQNWFKKNPNCDDLF